MLKHIFQRISRVGDQWKDMNKKAASIMQARKKLANL